MGIENTYDFRGFLGIKSVLCYKDLNCKIEVDKGTTTNVKKHRHNHYKCLEVFFNDVFESSNFQ